MSEELQKEMIFTLQNKKFQIAVEETSYHLRERSMHAAHQQMKENGKINKDRFKKHLNKCQITVLFMQSVCMIVY